MTWRGIHRWLAILLVVPLVVWSITGLLFHLKPGWARAYDMLDAERPEPALHAAQLAPLETIGGDPIQHLDVFDTALGPLARVTTAKATALYDVATGKPRSPLSQDDAKLLALDAISRSPHRSDYGEPTTITTMPELVRIVFGSTTVEVGRNDARISQRGADTDRIDWMYRIHYLQWTGHKTVDRVLAVVGLLLIWAVLIPGLVLFVRRLRIE